MRCKFSSSDFFGEFWQCFYMPCIRKCNRALSNNIYTVELQWLEHLWNHENMFETGVVRANAKYGYPLEFLNMKAYCVFSLAWPHRGDSNEYTQYTIFNMNKKNTLNYPKSAAMGFFPRDSRTSSK